MGEIVVTSDGQVQAALARAKPGDQILFAEGRYAPIRTNRRWAAPGITVRPQGKAKVVLGPFTCDGAAGITLEDLAIDTGDGVGVMMGGQNPERIVVQRCELHGAVVDPDGIRTKGGIAVSFGKVSVDCALIDCDIHHVGGGVNGEAGIRTRVVGNRFHDLRGDAMHFRPGKDLLIERNVIRNIFAPMAAHLDGIQLTTAGLSSPPEGIIIRRNRLLRGEGDAYQSIFANNEASLPYRGVIIEENLVAGGQYHGITLRMAEGPIIRSNYVTGDSGSRDGRTVMTPWIKVMDSTDAVVTGNMTTSGPIFQNTTIANQKGNKGIKLPKAGDGAAADSWWAQTIGPQSSLGDWSGAATLGLGLFVGRAAAQPQSRRGAIGQMLAAVTMRIR